MTRVYKAFPGGKHKVLTLSYDDGKVEDRRLVKIFNKYGIKATFNVNSGMFDTEGRIHEDEWESLYAGHEIAAHTVSHPTLIRCSDYEVTMELLKDKTSLEKLTLSPVQGIAYPNGSCDDRIVNIARSLGFKYGRLAADKYSAVCEAKQYKDKAQGPILLGDETGFGMPDDYMRWLPTCHHNHNICEFAKDFMALHKSQYLYMMYVWGHSFEFERNNNWEVIEEFCEMIGGRDDIWYATNIEIVNYNEAFSRLVFFADNDYVYNPNAVSVWVAVNTNDNYIEIPAGSTVKLG
ncbi:MAG: polysaccharide deacetylase family protein [Lachnospira sp.]